MANLYTSGTKIVWRPEKVIAHVRQAMEQRLRELGPEVQARVKANVSVPTATAGPSSPGDFPHAETFNLRDSIWWKVVSERKGAALFVGADAKDASGFDYGLFHEFTSGRSYLRRTLAEMGAEINRRLTTPIPGLK